MTLSNHRPRVKAGHTAADVAEIIGWSMIYSSSLNRLNTSKADT